KCPGRANSARPRSGSENSRCLPQVERGSKLRRPSRQLRQRGQQMGRTITLVTVAAPLARVPALTAATGNPRVEIADLHRIVKVSDPQISPDGKSVVCVVARANIKDDEWESELVLVATGPGDASSRPLTYGRKHVSDPRWSPSGDRIAFISEAGTGQGPENPISLLPLNAAPPPQLTPTPQCAPPL